MSRFSGIAMLVVAAGCAQQATPGANSVSSPSPRTSGPSTQTKRPAAPPASGPVCDPEPTCLVAPPSEQERSEADLAGLPQRGTRLVGGVMPTPKDEYSAVRVRSSVELTTGEQPLRLLVAKARMSSAAAIVVREGCGSLCVLGSQYFGMGGKRSDIGVVSSWRSPSRPLAVALLEVIDGVGVPLAAGGPTTLDIISWVLLATDGTDTWSPSRGMGGLQDFRVTLAPSGDTVELRASGKDGRSRSFVLSPDARTLVPSDSAPFVSAALPAPVANQLPEWSFSALNYPAIDPTGTAIAVFTSDSDGIGTLPNGRVELLRKSGKPLVYPLLAQAALRKALASPDPAQSARELSGLQPWIERNVDDVNQVIDDRWKPLTPCAEPTPGFWDAAMADAPQTGECGKTKYRYHHARISWGPHGTEHTRRLPAAQGNAIETPDGSIAMRDAVSHAFYDARTQTMLLQIDYSMPAGGDGYGQATQWELVPLR